MSVICVGAHSYREAILLELEKLAAEFPARDFWHTDILSGPNAWSSRPCGTRAADVIRHSPDEMRAALRSSGG
jgi:hypothetical protein